jgi:hypothetical protein
MKLLDYILLKLAASNAKVSAINSTHNGATLATMPLNIVFLVSNPDKLIEFEVRAGENQIGWIYRDDINFVIYRDAEGKYYSIEISDCRKLVEFIAKTNRGLCEVPTQNHMRKDGEQTLYYISEGALKEHAQEILLS